MELNPDILLDVRFLSIALSKLIIFYKKRKKKAYLEFDKLR